MNIINKQISSFIFFTEASLKVISENRKSKLSKSDCESISSQGENGEMEKRNAPSSSKSHRKTKSISQPANNQRLSMKKAYDTVELRIPEKEETLSKDEEKKCEKIEENTNSSHTKLELKEQFKSKLLRRYGVAMIFQW